MNQIVLDFAALNKLAQCTGPVAVSDPAGRVFGVFQPAATLSPQVDEAELDRRMADESGEFTTDVVLQLIQPGGSYPVWSPDRAFTAAAALMNALEDEKAKQ